MLRSGETALRLKVQIEEVRVATSVSDLASAFVQSVQKHGAQTQLFQKCFPLLDKRCCCKKPRYNLPVAYGDNFVKFPDFSLTT